MSSVRDLRNRLNNFIGPNEARRREAELRRQEQEHPQRLGPFSGRRHQNLPARLRGIIGNHEVNAREAQLINDSDFTRRDRIPPVNESSAGVGTYRAHPNAVNQYRITGGRGAAGQAGTINFGPRANSVGRTIPQFGVTFFHGSRSRPHSWIDLQTCRYVTEAQNNRSRR